MVHLRKFQDYHLRACIRVMFPAYIQLGMRKWPMKNGDPNDQKGLKTAFNGFDVFRIDWGYRACFRVQGRSVPAAPLVYSA
jgi:hypothetical protein